MASIQKADAVAALRVCGGDVSQKALWAAGLSRSDAAVLSKILDDLHLTVKGGHGNLRTLIVPLEEAIRLVGDIEGDELEAPDREDSAASDYYVVHDPHGNYDVGQRIAHVYLLDLVSLSRHQVDANGLEISNGLHTYRIYHGTLYRLVDGNMLPV